MSRQGLPYGWWKSPDLWAFIVFGGLTIATMLFLAGAWFEVW